MLAAAADQPTNQKERWDFYFESTSAETYAASLPGNNNNTLYRVVLLVWLLIVGRNGGVGNDGYETYSQNQK